MALVINYFDDSNSLAAIINQDKLLENSSCYKPYTNNKENRSQAVSEHTHMHANRYEVPGTIGAIPDASP